ncbi:MAG: ATP-binding cassette domain-containing protein [Bacteroidia bacterium]|nr:ATP-binding cassette domain-containing protein [Bacteroidia bacterium]
MSLEIQHLEISYGKHRVLYDASLFLPAGEIHGLVGVNGAGKTSLLNAISGLKIAQQGVVLWKGKCIQGTDLAYMESSLFFYPRMTGLDYMQLFAASNPGFRLEDWNELFHLPLHEYIENYSSGMQKKLALMGIIALGRPLWLLDEPFNTLDLEAVELLKKLLPSFSKKGTTVLLTSHILETLTETCTKIHFMDQGSIRFSYPENEFQLLQQEIARHASEKYDEKINRAMG